MDNDQILFREIIKGLGSRDNKIQERIYKLYWGYLMGVAMRYLQDRDTAKEVVNDSFIKAFKNMYDFKHDDVLDDFKKTFKSWLARITARTALDRIRSNKTMLSYVDEYTEHPTNHVYVDDKLHVEDILKLLHRLPDLHKTVFNLYEIEGFSHDEIAKMIHIPESSSRTYLTRAKQKLRELYKKNMEC
ncbi:RNA polymerase sigma factor [Pedobacter sp. MC2016-14]|uniref:RNA polymerase sigma factor n=1 Tax=Pedobacter sp. MC2016-14 TaxID=2897327 RepID=UPI001E49C18C|nr:RNA polymerase sigma factor [Pedobacter sp. MC2016-14]